jgi:hypothetical protein
MSWQAHSVLNAGVLDAKKVKKTLNLKVLMRMLMVHH